MPRNWSFSDFEKKPYKLKLAKKESLLGMSKNKHFVLLAQATGSPKYMDTPIGFEVSRILELRWTPEERPVEIVINGEYMGLYCLTEHVRVGENRVNIEEQADYESDISLIETGGWLVELDFYDDEPQIEIDVTDTDIQSASGKKMFKVTVHSPEKLSEGQFNYLRTQFQQLKNTVFVEDKESTEWEDYVDMEELVKYAMQAQITTRMEAFMGSTFIYKKDGESKWCFGPVWDLESSIKHAVDDIFTWDETNYSGISILHEIAKFPRFQEQLRKTWFHVRNKRDYLHSFVDSICNNLKEAVIHDAERWPQYGCANINECREKAKELIDYRWAWLDNQFMGNPSGILEHKGNMVGRIVLYDLSGNKILYDKHVNTNIPEGIYIIKSDMGTKKIVVN